MSLVDSAVKGFGETMGMAGLAFGETGVVRLKFESSGTLSIERTRTGAVLHLARPVDRFKEGVFERALHLCHFEQDNRERPHVGLARDGSLVFSARLSEKQMDASTLEATFDFLCRLHDRAAA